MSGTGYNVGAGTGAVVGGVGGAYFGGPVGALAGAGLGATVGGMIGESISPDTSQADAEEEAQRKLDDARNAYSSGVDRQNANDMAAYNKIATQQLQGQSDRVDKAQTGKQSAAMLNQSYTAALKSGNEAANAAIPEPGVAAPASGRTASATPMAQAQAHGPLAAQNTILAQNRGQAAMLADAYNVSVMKIQDLAAEATQKYSLDEIKLNRQIAYVANVSGIERAVLAAKYAAATGQYPLDMENAAHAGDRAAMQRGLIGGAANIATSVGSMMGPSTTEVGTGEPGSTLDGGSGDVGGGEEFDAGTAPSGYDDPTNLPG